MRVEVYGCSGNVFVKNFVCSSRVSLIPDLFFAKTFLQSSTFVSFNNVSISTSEFQFHSFMLSLFSVTFLSSPSHPRNRFFFFSLDLELREIFFMNYQ